MTMKPSAMRTAFHCGLVGGSLLASGVAHAVPGPDSVAVVFNRNVPGSVALAARYGDARGIPARQRCGLDLPTTDTISLAEYRTRLSAPLARCLQDAGVDARIEAYTVIRGVPLRVSVPAAGGEQVASLAAVLMVERSRLLDGTPFLDSASPGTVRMCGTTPCLGARWSNPFTVAPFSPAWTVDRGGVHWDLRLVTMLHGRTDEEAGRLLQSAIDGDQNGRVEGTWMLMNGADPARGVLDTQYDRVIADLRARGVTDVVREPFNTALTGRTLAAYVTGTASLGATIEGNRFAPGAIVDNLTSLGAVPVNFTTGSEAQVSIARWAAVGVAGAHGAVEEPLNNCFPHRRLLTEYAEGSTLAEVYLRNMPFVFWRNLVLGDPMAAPWAKRPRVTVAGIAQNDTLDRPTLLDVRAQAPDGGVVASTVLYVDGVERARADGDALRFCLEGDGPRDLLVVSQLAPNDTVGLHTPKGWTHLRVTLRNASMGCATDAGLADASSPTDAPARSDSTVDATADASADASTAPTAPPPAAGCACRTSPNDRPRAALAPLVACVALAAARRRHSAQRSSARVRPAHALPT